jgi:hypothetical protein
MLNKEIKKNLKEQIKHKEIQLREERYNYLGLLQTYQKCGVKEFDYKKLNNKQRFIFKRVLHGRNAFKNQKDFESLDIKTKSKIKRHWSSAQRIINNFKNQVCNIYGNIIFSKFEALEFVTEIPISKVDRSIININTLKELGIDYNDLILLFIQNKLLPSNFLKIK